MITEEFWSAYADLQSTLGKTSTITPKTLAMEASLTAMLQNPALLEQTSSEINRFLQRSLNAANWLERSHQRLRLIHHDEIDIKSNDASGLDAAVALREVAETLTSGEWTLITSIAEGKTYEELSSPGSSAQALRVKVSRLRAGLRKAA